VPDAATEGMPRPLRPELAGGIHHVYSRGAVRQMIFVDDLDRRRYLFQLARVVRRMSWRLLTYCLMGNHMHLVIETPKPNLGRGMQRLHGPYGQAFNRRHAKAGHVFGARYDAVVIESDPQLWITVGYVVRNPVEAGLCATPQAWRWSSHVAVCTGLYPPWLDVPRLLRYFGQDGGDPLRRYREFAEARIKAT
jgi:putative transposase